MPWLGLVSRVAVRLGLPWSFASTPAALPTVSVAF